jgi:hypothetical protein
MHRFSPWNFAFLVLANILLCGFAFAGDDTYLATVPDGYVATPFGYFHRSCVHSLAKGEKTLPDGRVQHADATVDEYAAVCDYPRYTSTGQLSSSVSTKPEVDGWMENASIATGSTSQSYGALSATWTVPAHPKADDGQLLYFFPGLEDKNNVESILQPVLRWYQGQWTIASWNCCMSGMAWSSPLVNVEPGDEILGSITSNCRTGSLTCATWNVLTLDQTTGESTMLRGTPSEGQVFNWAFGAVLEPYFVVSCDDYPPNQQLNFDKIVVFDQNMHPVASPKWATTSNATQTPQCSYGVKANLNEATLRF